MEYGHTASRLIGGGFIDAWGAGPFVIDVDGKLHRFEDSDRFGPQKVLKNGEVAKNPLWPSSHPFWEAHRLWRTQGRHVAEDGETCVWNDTRFDPA